MTTNKPPKPPSPPAGTGRRGRKIWRDVVSTWELDEGEMALLGELVRTVDTLDRLQTVIADEGEIIVDRFGERKVHPAVVEARQLRITMARVLAALRVPESDEADGRTQRRVGVRTPYQLRAVGE